MPVTIEEEIDPRADASQGSDSEEDDDSTSSGGNDVDATSSSPPPLPAHAHYYFAPPFYGRPGTPLPPSPSFTSLLIPSRPTTPDLSDDEPAAMAAAAAAAASSEKHSSSATATTTGPHFGGHVSTASRSSGPKVPTYEYYGFVVYLFSSLTFLVYLLWSYLPSPLLHGLGIYYYPNRWWSLAVPAFIVMALVYVFVALASYNTRHLTSPLGAVDTVVDDAGQVAVVDAKGRMRDGSRRTRSRRVGGKGKGRGLNYKAVWSQGTDAVMDVPLAGVCEVLHRKEAGLR